jgi:uncharacterized membrane protein YfcA
MLLLGMLLGFVGAGGAGFIIALLTVVFHIPIHTALGTSLAGMAFTSFSGAFSHYREGNMNIKTGLIVGVFAAFGAYIGAKLAFLFPEYLLHYFTAGMLFLSAILMLVKLFLQDEKEKQPLGAADMWIRSVLLGIFSGILSGTFGIGSAPFIQLGLLILLRLSIRQSVGTTMLVILPIAIGGGVGYFMNGAVDGMLLLQILIGTVSGSYIGAKFTNLAPKPILKTALFLTPAMAGVILLL